VFRGSPARLSTVIHRSTEPIPSGCDGGHAARAGHLPVIHIVHSTYDDDYLVMDPE